MPLDGVFIGEKSLRSGSGSELRGTHPMRVGFGGFQMVTVHRFSGEIVGQMVVLGLSLQETCVATVAGPEKGVRIGRLRSDPMRLLAIF